MNAHSLPGGASPEPASWGLAANDEIDESLVVIRLLGGGRRYEVYEAWDRRLFTRVAVKLLRPDQLTDERALSVLLREAEIASRLAHPNLVRLLRWSSAPPRPHLVLELVAAPTLDEHLDAVGPLAIPDTCLLGIRMLSALRYLHGEGLLHLDVKPANVTLGDPPRLLDLSLARPGGAQERRVGTPAYMSPEQVRQEPLTPATDVFGLGATLYEAIAGMQAFSDGDLEAPDLAARYPQLEGEAVPLRELSQGAALELDGIVMACLARDARARPSVLDAALALERVLEALGRSDLVAWPKGLDPLPRAKGATARG